MQLKKMGFIFILILIITILATACSNKEADLEFTTKTSFVMGTLLKVKVYGDRSEEVATEVIAEMQRLEKLMSTSIEDSEVNRINENAGIKPVKVSSDTFEVIKLAREYAVMTGGLFDPTIGPLVELWGIGTTDSRVPAPEEIEAVLPLIDYNYLILDEKESTVFLQKKDMILDVGGIAKGFASDRAIDIFRKNGVKYAYIDIGGNVMVHGTKPDGSLWAIGIQDPRDTRNNLVGVVKLQSKAVITSGDYERYFEEQGERYHHILNPRTGYPARTGLISVSIIGDSSFHADALSTSIFLLGEEGLSLVKDLGYEAMLITDEKEIILTDGLKKLLQITNEQYQLKEN